MLSFDPIFFYTDTLYTRNNDNIAAIRPKR